MRKYRKWVLTLGIMAATPGIASAANPLAQIFKGKSTPRRTAARPTNARPSNQQVAEAIAKALRSAKLNGYAMEVEYSNGVCKLGGEIGTASQKAAATRVVQAVPGVQRVDNRLVIRKSNNPFAFGKKPVQQAGYDTRKKTSGARFAGYKPAAAIQNNQKTAEQIAQSLKSAGLSGYDIEIRYQNGVAQLAGAVASPQQRAKAGQVVQRIPGVRSVQNMLSVAGQRRPRSVTPAASWQPNPGMAPAPQMMMAHGGAGARQTVHNQAHLPEHAWPSYASYPNYAQVAYPKQYSASAWPYIGPFYPYPQVPLGWRQVQLEWDDGYWNLNFRPRTEKWWWFLNPKNW